MGTFRTRLIGSEEVAEGTVAFRFARPAEFEFKAGQSVNLGLVDPPETDAKGNRRTFSLVSAPFEPEIVCATRMRDTAFKRVLKAMPKGQEVELRGPAGQFTLAPGEATPAVFLAGGIGITPFVSMLRQAAKDRLARRLTLFYSNRRPEDAAFLDELSGLQRQNANYEFVGTMTEMQKSVRTWKGETGFIDRAMLERHLGDAPGAIYYMAGPPAMVEAVQKMLAGAGVKDEAIRSDEFYGY
ncbi:MAG: FAD-dependent oxidoreductase [Burkholderiales bacterium]